MKLNWLFIIIFSVCIVCIFSIDPINAKGQPKIIISSGHSEVVSAIALSPDGKYLASGSWDYSVRLWDIASGREIRIFRGHDFNIECLAFSNDGKQLLSGSKIIKIWDIKTGKEIKTIDNEMTHSTVVEFSPDRKYAAINGSGDNIAILNLASGKIKLLKARMENNIYSFAFSRDGKYGVSGGWDRKVRLWNIEQGKLIREFKGHTDGIYTVDYSPDGKYLLSGGDDNVVILWDTKTGKMIRKIVGFTRKIANVKFSPDGKSFLISTWDREIQLWDTLKGRKIKEYKGHTHGVIALTFYGDGTKFVSGSADRTIKIWDLKSGKTIKGFPGTPPDIEAVAISEDGKYLATVNEDNIINVWDRENNRFFRSLIGHSDYMHSIAISPDNQYIVSGSSDKIARIWNIANGKLIKVFRHNSGVSAVGFLNNGKQLITSCKDGIMVWDIKNEKLLKTLNECNASQFCISPNQNYLVAVRNYGGLTIWDLKRSKPIRALFEINGQPYSESLTNIKIEDYSPFASPNYSITSIVISHNGKYIAEGSDPTIRIWDMNTGRLLNRFNDKSGMITSVTFSYDDQSIILGTGAGNNSSLKVYSVKTGKLQHVLAEKIRPIEGLAFSTKGNYLISAGWDGFLQLWDYTTYKEIASLYKFNDNNWLIITPEGNYYGTSNVNKYMYLSQKKDHLIAVNDSYKKNHFKPNLKLQTLRYQSLPITSDVAFQSTIPETIFREVIAPKKGEDGRDIIYEIVKDIDSDGISEKIVLDVDKSIDQGEYSRLLIYNLVEGKDELVFDSTKAGINIVGVYFDDTPDLIKIEDNDQNGVPEIYLLEWGFASDPCRTAIIEKVNGQYEVLFYDHIDGYGYEDLNNDGKLELYGYTAMGGQTAYNAALITAFVRKGIQYVPSYDCTRKLITKKLTEAKDLFKKEPTIGYAMYLISLFVLNGNKDELRTYLRENRSLFEQVNYSFKDDNEINSFVDNLNSLFAVKNQWWESLKKQSDINT